MAFLSGALSCSETFLVIIAELAALFVFKVSNFFENEHFN